ncbi:MULTISPECIES: hypothetical protein [unclassified Pseudomonas]|uniref:hypothetical protein n=1 Tax=unclassified Pseudomonas TaxID=196821 RepID=UPI000A1DA993|nr:MULTISPECIES: hypothetical protein [unclassified Pseudomonas]
MAIAIITALLIHVVWLVNSYTHTNPESARKVRTVAAFASLVLTIALFILIQREIAAFLTLYAAPSGSVAVDTVGP